MRDPPHWGGDPCCTVWTMLHVTCCTVWTMLHDTCCTLGTPPPSGWGAMLHCVDPCCIRNFRCVDLSRCVNFLFVVPFGTMLHGGPPWGGDPCCTVWTMLHDTCCTLGTPLHRGWGAMLHCVDPCYIRNFRCVDLSRCLNFLFVVPFGTMLHAGPPSLGWGSMLHCVDHVACYMLHCVDHVACYMLHSRDPPPSGWGAMLHCVDPCCIRNFRCVDLSRCLNFLFVVPFGTMLHGDPPGVGIHVALCGPCCMLHVAL